MEATSDPRFAPPKIPRKGLPFSWSRLLFWVGKEAAVWVTVLASLWVSGVISYAALLVSNFSDYRTAGVFFLIGSVFSMAAGFLLWGRNRGRGTLVMAILHLGVFAAAFHLQNPGPTKIADEFLALRANRGPSSLQRLLRIVLPPSFLYLARVGEDVARPVRLVRAMREQPEKMCPGLPASQRMGCYKQWVNRFRTAQPLTFPGQLIMASASLLVVRDMDKAEPNLKGDQKKRRDAVLILDLLEALALNVEVFRTGVVHPWQLVGAPAEPNPPTLAELTKMIRSARLSEVDLFLVSAIDKVAYLTLLQTMAGEGEKGLFFVDTFKALRKMSSLLNAEQQQRMLAQEQWFSQFQAWVKATVPAQLDKALPKGT